MSETLTLEEAIGLAEKVEKWHSLGPCGLSWGHRILHRYQGLIENFQVEIEKHEMRWRQEYQYKEVEIPKGVYLGNIKRLLPKPDNLPSNGEWYGIKIASEKIVVVRYSTENGYKDQESRFEQLDMLITDKLEKDKIARGQSILDTAREILT